MKHHTQEQSRQTGRCIGWMLALWLLTAQVAFAQPDPRHTFWQEVKPYGTMYGVWG